MFIYAACNSCLNILTFDSIKLTQNLLTKSTSFAAVRSLITLIRWHIFE